MTSRDNIRWCRPERGRPLIARGPEDSFSGGSIRLRGQQPRASRDEVWLDYTAQPFTHGDYSLAEQETRRSVMRAMLRCVGFVSADAGR